MPSDVALGWLCLQQVPELGPARLRRLANKFKTPERALAASPAAWRALSIPLTPAAAQRQAFAARSQAEAWLARIAAIGGWVMLWSDPDYPQRWHGRPSAPVLLFGLGQREALNPAEAAAIIGTRRPTGAGVRLAEQVARDVAAAGVTVVSGLARGIDAAAHRGALQGGVTVAVLGSGLDVIYPPEHRRLARDIAETGAVITEYPPGTEPEPFRFPQRNRLISALSDLIYVVEAASRSGTVKTATQALEDDMKVMAWLGHPASPQSAFPRKLLLDGAKPCSSGAELLAFLRKPREDDRAVQPETEPERAVPTAPTMPSGPAGTVLAALADAGEATPAQLAGATALPLAAVLSVLMLLELQGFVVQLPGTRYAALHGALPGTLPGAVDTASLAGSASL